MCSLTYIKKLSGDPEVRDHFISLLSLIEFGNLLHENSGEPLSLNSTSAYCAFMETVFMLINTEMVVLKENTEEMKKEKNELNSTHTEKKKKKSIIVTSRSVWFKSCCSRTKCQ